MKGNLEQLCIKYNLGQLTAEVVPVSGGLLHKMYHVTTTQGEYAIKHLNPSIMKRPEAWQNMINSEKIAEKLQGIIPLVAAKNFGGNTVIEQKGNYYMVFDWQEGKSVFAPDITEYHCEQIGRILGKVHAADSCVSGLKKQEAIREPYNWKEFHGNATLLQNHLSELMTWDNATVHALKQLSGYQVISHRDLDPKNVMWKDNQPYVIDWESAGYVNPYQELIEVLNYWITDVSGAYSRSMFTALIHAYTESMSIGNVDWDSALTCGFDGMLGWLEYNVKRALGIEGDGSRERAEGLEQVKGTIAELKQYEKRIELLKNWLKEEKACQK